MRSSLSNPASPSTLNFQGVTVSLILAERALRDSSNVVLKPHVVPFRVQATRYDRDINYNESWAIVSVVAAAIEQPEYADKTFGVITLVGEAQALEIERLLRQRLAVTEFERRRIVCGNAAHFQGDERDVMFLSMVDIPESGPLPLRQDDRFKQRYNVAASRARDQMWVVYILDPLGWTFVRVRGTEFFRHPDRALQPVFEMIERLEIPPVGPTPADEEPWRQAGELLNRVLSRADELRREWLDSGSAANGR